MILFHIAMVAGGLVLIGWGLWAAHHLKKPFDTIGAILTPVGLILALVGVLLICVPGFFSS